MARRDSGTFLQGASPSGPYTVIPGACCHPRPLGVFGARAARPTIDVTIDVGCGLLAALLAPLLVGLGTLLGTLDGNIR
jgi:hypothetical protein